MDIGEHILQAFGSLRANKMRALLTMLGIIIGVGSVIAIVTLGDSLTGYITGSMQSLGANSVTISLQSKSDEGSGGGMMALMGGSSGGMQDKDLLTADMLESLQAQYPDEIEAFSISDSVGSGQVKKGRAYANLSLVGVNEDYGSANSVNLLAGRFIGERDTEGARKVAVVSEKLVANIFGGRNADALGQQITIQTGDHVGTYTIVGVYEYDSSAYMSTASDKDISTNVYIPLTLANKITRTGGYQSVTMLTASSVDSAAFADTAAAYLSRFYTNNPDYGVTTFSMESMLDTLNDMLSTIQLAIAAIAAISLLVGGIGVMNIMMVSITERTREIGTRKALGSTNLEIRMQFIIEAMIICLIGGLIGVALGMALGAAGASLLGAPASISIATILGVTAFSMFIGVFFGYYPANKAAKMDPIEALRYE